MANNDTTTARDFHHSTKLRYIDLKTKPPLYKSYPGRPLIPLPDIAPLEAPTLSCLTGITSPADAHMDLQALAQLLHYSAGLIRKSEIASAGEVHYRAAASAGALYPIELYVVCGNIPGLEAGVYHYAPSENALVRLRQGDYRKHLAEAAADEGMASAAATIVCSVVFWRSAWKYRTRGYRYCFWDNGTVLSNLLAAANGLGQPARLVTGFVDTEVDGLLGLDGEREASNCLVTVGNGSPPSAETTGLTADSITGELGTGELGTGELGDEQRLSYGESELLHSESRLRDANEVSEWRGESVASGAPAAAPALESDPLGQVISQRGSTRRFAREDFPGEQFSALLRAAASPIPADYGGGLIDTYLIVNAVDGVEPGAYYYSPSRARGPVRLVMLREGELREEAGHLCFEQALAADASAVAFFMADLDAALGRFGNRGYRIAQLEAGIIGGRMYLASHALGLGATGMTFFDDAVTAFFSPHAAGKSLMFLVGFGVIGRPNQVRPFRSRIGMLKDSLARGAGGGKRPVPDWLYD